jgi:hypothetical protein
MVGLLLAGCADPPVQPDPQPFVVENADVSAALAQLYTFETPR